MPRVWVVILLMGVALGARGAGDPRGTSRRPNVLLIVLDTVRFDAISSTNTPFLDSLGKRATVFTLAYSTHDFTPTSHFSIMTGLRDGIATDDDRMENGLAWQLRQNGYSTFATVANGLITPPQMPVLGGFGDFKAVGDVTGSDPADVLTDLTEIDERLALFHVRATRHTRAMLYYSADRLLPVFLQQIKSAKPPFFGFVNLVDAHEPYVPHPETYHPEVTLPENFAGDVMSRRIIPQMAHPEIIRDPQQRALVTAKLAEVGYPRLLSLDLSPETLAIYKARYMATVHDLDGVLREFFNAADHEHLLDNTIVIITSDHGEEFGESGYITHMLRDHGDYEATHHVPLIILVPPSISRAGASVVTRRVSLASLAATIYDVAGLDWSPLSNRYVDYPRSLAPLLMPLPRRVAHVALPASSPQDHSDANRQRETTMRSLGYIQ